MFYAKELAFYVMLVVILCGLLMLFAHWVLYPFFIKCYTQKKMRTLKQHMDKFRGLLQVPDGARKLTFIGSSQYEGRMKLSAEKYREDGYVVYLPGFDHEYSDSLILWNANREVIKAGDAVVVFWDQRSTGTIFDIGMAFAMEKHIIIGYLEQATIGTTLLKLVGGQTE